MTRKRIESKSVKEVFAGEEVALADLYILISARRKYLWVSSAVFFVLGIIIALTSPLEYEAEAQILSENTDSEGSTLSGLAGLAGLAGISVPQGGGQTAVLSQAMYPAIVASEPFLLDLMQERFYFQEEGREMSLFEYFSKKRPGHLFANIFGFLKRIPGRIVSTLERKKEWDIPQNVINDEGGGNLKDQRKLKIVQITEEQRKVIKQLESRILIEATGMIVSVKVKMPEPYVSAKLNAIVVDKVMNYVVAYKTDKQRENLRFIEERTEEAKENFKQAQLRLAAFRDSNQGIVMQSVLTREEQLKAEFDLSFNVYNGLAQQLEQTKIQLKKDTPLFSEFEPVAVPLENAEPNVLRILVLYLALGLFFGGVLLFISILRAYRLETNQAPKAL